MRSFLVKIQNCFVQKILIEDDEILNECLADVVGTSDPIIKNSSITESTSVENLATQRKRNVSPPVSIPERPIKLLRIDGDSLKFYFVDAFENIYKNPGEIYC